jgi:YD repeat-containing protein
VTGSPPVQQDDASHNDDGVQEPVRHHDGNGNLEKVTDAEGNETDYLYAPNGDLEQVSGPRAGQVTLLTYDSFGNPRETKDGEGNVTTTITTPSHDVLDRHPGEPDPGFRQLDRRRPSPERTTRVFRRR